MRQTTRTTAGYLQPGYVRDGSAAEPCPSGSIAPGVRELAEGGACAPCPDGFDTAGLEGQSGCQGNIQCHVLDFLDASCQHA